eukprot:7344980-Pyramimonas_sp.AAC.1
MPCEAVSGSASRPQTWAGVQSLADSALSLIDSGRSDIACSLLGKLYQRWADTAERELVPLVGPRQ